MNKRQSIWLLMILGSVLLLGCGSPHGADCLYPFREGNLYGYLGPDGSVVVPAQFAYTMPFQEGMGAFNVGGNTVGRDMPTDGKWGFINSKGQIVINPKYTSPPVSALPFVPEALGRIRHQGYMFSDSLAGVIKEGEWVFIDPRGNIVISEGGNTPRFAAVRTFKEGLANVMVNNRWGYMEKSGRMAIPAQFLYPADFQEGYALVITDDLSWIVIDKHGNRVLPEYRIVTNFYEGIAAVMGDFKGVPENVDQVLRFWFVDTSGIRIPEEPQFDDVGHYGGGLCPVLVGSEKSEEKNTYPGLVRAAKRIGGKWGYIRRDGSFGIVPSFDGARSFHKGLAAVRKGDLFAYINVAGEYVTEFEFRFAGDFDECGIAVVQLGPSHNDFDGHFGYMNTSGEVIWIEADLPY